MYFDRVSSVRCLAAILTVRFDRCTRLPKHRNRCRAECCRTLKVTGKRQPEDRRSVEMAVARQAERARFYTRHGLPITTITFVKHILYIYTYE